MYRSNRLETENHHVIISIIMLLAITYFSFVIFVNSIYKAVRNSCMRFIQNPICPSGFSEQGTH